jgi:transcriptional regulator with XRE-family HTH domain
MRVAVGGEIRRMRVDAGLTQRRLVSMAEIDHGFLSLIERGLREPSLAVLVSIATALGGNVNVRLYPGTGPRLTDPIQARITEALVHILHPRWIRMLEVSVYRPVRGVIDVALHDREANIVVATEIQSQIRRLEQKVRWSNEKAEALPSAEFWRFVDPAPRIDRLLILRSTRVNRELVSRFAQTIAVAYPASPEMAFKALTSAADPWPGSALLWATVDGESVHILDRSPRGVTLNGVETGSDWALSRETRAPASAPDRPWSPGWPQRQAPDRPRDQALRPAP